MEIFPKSKKKSSNLIDKKECTLHSETMAMINQLSSQDEYVEPDFSKQNGLVPVIVQEIETHEVLMQAYMDKEAWEATLRTGLAHYYSRSRNGLWKKGETSGHIQQVKEIYLDCDTDCVLLKVIQVGGIACHTGHRSCFFNRVK
jgi:phosphoribosyl-AMP cyclohydrolase